MTKPRLTPKRLDALCALVALAEADLDADESQEKPIRTRAEAAAMYDAIEWVRAMARWQREKGESRGKKERQG